MTYELVGRALVTLGDVADELSALTGPAFGWLRTNPDACPLTA